MHRLLERNGMHVLTAVDGKEAMDVLLKHMPEVILLDIEMPIMDGYAVADRVRHDARLAAIPIIMVTMRTDEGSRNRARNAGVTCFLSKPLRGSELIFTIRHYTKADFGVRDIAADTDYGELIG
jgi:chemosensory pili system protein ChpA (sensor histidine kinase/response regulator)